MDNQDALFDLIKSLSKTEKRYFTLFAAQHTKGDKNNYLSVFNAIDKQKKYNESRLLEVFKGVSAINKLRLSKQYLYRQILKSMQVYRSEANMDMQLKGMLSNVAFLFEKGLDKQCEKLITKTKKLAEKNEKHFFLLECFDWELILMRKQSFSEKTEQEMKQFYQEKYNVIKSYHNLSEHFLIRDSLLIKTDRYSIPRNEGDLLVLQDIYNNSLLKTKEEALSVRALYLNNFCHLHYFFFGNDYRNAYIYAQNNVQLLEAHPFQIKENISTYICALFNLMLCQVNNKMYKEIPLTMKKLITIKTKSKHANNQIFLFSNFTYLDMYIDTGQFDKGIELVEEIQHNISNNNILYNKHNEKNMYLKFVLIYFCAGDHANANRILNDILNDTTIDTRTDIMCFAQIFHLILHFEKDNENRDYIEYRVVTANRFLKNRDRVYQFEKVILDFFRKELPKTYTKKEQINAFETLKAAIEKIIKDPFEKNALKHFDFISWLESKIEGKTFAEVVRRKLVESS